MENFITATNNSIQQLQTQNKLMENQISQLAHQVGQSSKTPGTFPSQTKQPQKGHMNVMTLRTGKQLEDPPVRKPSKEVVEEVVTNEKEVDISVIEKEPRASIPPPLAPYVPQDILSNKKKLEENATLALTAECSAILQNTLPKKLGDPGSYSIPVKLGDIEINRALCDLGGSVSLMPLSICKKLQMGELNPTRISLQLADRSIKFPLGVLEDVPLRVGKFFIPYDFVVMEMEEDAYVPVILGRPFLATAGAIIDMKNGKITFEVGDEKIEYSLLNAMGTPSMGETICQVDVLDDLQRDQLPLIKTDDALETVLMGSANHEDWETREYTRLLEEAKANPITASVKEVLSASSFRESTTPPEVELKPLPSTLKCAYLGPNNKYPIIVNAELSDTKLE
ncbi:uncharacterized protein LOC110698244 [Chenopodium quinoa]|uniref:uncharacterized protein LOC110698244 n=1 Tax=Chenopodium quinoa TaxID=63459 RepID=UPI000B76C8F7|nr:uncharacterized protein LOC110698244 [Chenopodium quinoa]